MKMTKTSGDRGNEGNLTEEHPTLPQRSAQQKQASPPYHICDHEFRGECSENWEKNCRKRQRICSACKIYFFNWKTWLPRASLHIANCHISSCKTTENEGAYANEGKQKCRHSASFAFALDKNSLEEKQQSV